ncbi:unnamed protein product [Prorocentrum cordatum]|uniref:Uncharacterized protein n=1 Tax=Prorocentrum cordatum TaxID=2364126 RepID=A0ABN9Y5L6_9DINO|nr:unnamed protein product [Polarella glacialis]
MAYVYLLGPRGAALRAGTKAGDTSKEHCCNFRSVPGQALLRPAVNNSTRMNYSWLPRHLLASMYHSQYCVAAFWCILGMFLLGLCPLMNVCQQESWPRDQHSC